MLIPPEQVLEKSIEYFEQYGPKLEELFDVDLSDVMLKHFDEMAYDLHAFYRAVDIENPRTTGEIAAVNDIKTYGLLSLADCMRACLAAFPPVDRGFYFHDLDTMYVRSYDPVYELEMARTVVHELAHAVLNRLVPRDALPVESKLWPYVDEGFAEFVSVDLFRHEYGLPVSALEQNLRVFEHRSAVDFQKGMDGIIRQAKPELGEPAPDAKTYNPHAFGYVFFSYADAMAIKPLTIIENPPQEFSEIINPGEYVLRIRTEGKSL